MRIGLTLVLLFISSQLVLAQTGTSTDQPVSLPDGVTPPKPLNSHSILSADYPSGSLVNGEEGCTTIKYLIGADGTINREVVVRSSGWPKIDDAAMKVVKRWTFVPAMRDGKPVAIWQRTKLGFVQRYAVCYPDPDPHLPSDGNIIPPHRAPPSPPGSATP